MFVQDLPAARPSDCHGTRFGLASGEPMAPRHYSTIVSGLPRSGTSMMMRMLDAGGIPALTDHLRAADPSNPNGYYEYEPIKRTKEDPSWLPAAIGMAVKMVHVLLLDLPLTYAYRVVFMQRDIAEVIESQNRMLERLGKNSSDLPANRLGSIYQSQTDDVLRYLRRHTDRFSLLEVNYNAMIQDPLPQIERLSQYLDGLNTAAMAAVVDRNLYRTRIAR
jgi:hypothetical protein